MRQGPRPFDVDQEVRGVPFVGKAAMQLQDRGIATLRDESPKEDAPSRPIGRGSRVADEAVGREAHEQRIRSQLEQARNAKLQAGGSSPTSGGLTVGQAAGAAAAVGGAAGGGAGAALSGAAGAAGGDGVNAAGMGQKLGAGIVKGLWKSVAPTFGLTIYLLDLAFLLGFASKFFRKYIPEVGHEWIPEAMRKSIPKAALKPVKYAELTALFLITGLVSAVLTVAFAAIVYLISILMAVGQALH